MEHLSKRLQPESLCENCDRPSLQREWDRVSGGSFEQFGGLEGKRVGFIQEQAVYNSDYLCKSEKTPSTYVRGKEFQHDKGVLEIQGEGALCVCQQCKLEFSLLKNSKAGLLRCVAPRNDRQANKTPIPTLLFGEGEFKIASLVKEGGAKRRRDLINQKIAFTLAEVLITLGIIGIIAAMTMPALIGKYEKTVTVNKLKRSYTTISQMFNMARKDYGDPNEWSFSYGAMSNDDGTSNFSVVLPQVAQTYFLPYLDVVDDCGISCRKVPNNYTYLNGELINQFNKVLFYTMFLKDGSIIFVSVDNNSVTLQNLIIIVDINGLKGPNVMGKDVFSYYLTTAAASKTNFWGLTGAAVKRETLKDDTYRGCNKNAFGEYCGALIQYDGWQIKDDYPW